MVNDPRNNQPSNLLVDESFAAGSADFIERLREVSSPKYLAGIADRWKTDPRPWARAQIFAYLALPMDRPGHHPVVKRLFKHAEAEGDDALMAAFAVAFDRLIRKQRRITHHWDSQSRQLTEIEELFNPRNQILSTHTDVATPDGTSRGKFAARRESRVPRKGLLFSYTTRGYLRRRAWRYFRRIAFKRPAAYPRAVAAILAGYLDVDFAKGENILDNWSLLNACFRRSPELVFSARLIKLAEGASLKNLSAAPAHAQLWKLPESASVLLSLAVQAQSRLVRIWAMQLLKQDHLAALHQIDAMQLLAFLDHSDEDVQQFGAGLITSLAAANSWPVSTWLRLLETQSVTALSTICEVMSKRVSPDRFDLAQCITLTCARATPVARLGLSWLARRAITTEADRASLVRLADARCEALGQEIAQLALAILGAPESYSTDRISPFFDSLTTSIRLSAWEWLSPSSRGYNDAALWSRLLETPFDDVRIRLISELDKRTRFRASALLSRSDLSNIWTTTLLNIHRGGRSKLKALRQISEAIAAQPDQAERLLPVLSIAIRSVRPPEVRAGLSSILAAVSKHPSLEPALEKFLPELRLSPSGPAGRTT